ncbi:MAG: hypothetical protein D6698_13650 [Gammaproteobacteria bacterium]|nr:MAG: hypothetical protein D6698_13650 [Gammaproteobacteria bacterium]
MIRYTGRTVGVLSLVTMMMVMGCATPPIDKALNEGMAKRHAPLRYVLDDSRSNAGTRFFREAWAGEPGESHVNERYRKMALDRINRYCDLPPSAFIEARTVSFSETYIEEVWVFRDPLSKREDGLSGQTVMFRYDPETNRTDVSFSGACHTAAETTFSFAR